MSLPSGLVERIHRFALLEPSKVEIRHPLTPSHQIIGWSILRDECWQTGDGYGILKVIEAVAKVEFDAIRRELLRRGGV